MDRTEYFRFAFPKLFTWRTPGSFENRRVIVSGDIPQMAASSFTRKCRSNAVPDGFGLVLLSFNHSS
jgi:hypothetical protein